MLLSLVALLVSAPGGDATARALDRVETEIDAVVSDRIDRVEVRVRTRYSPASPLDRIAIVLAADRYRAPPKGLTPSAAREVFPGGFSPGGFEDVRVAVGGRPCTPSVETREQGERILSCPVTVEAGGEILVESSALLEVPDRYGPFGRRGRDLTLAGGWYPTVTRDAATAPPPGPHRVRVVLPADASALIGSRFFRATDGKARRTINALLPRVQQVPLVLRAASARGVSFAGGRGRYLTGPAREVLDPSERRLEVREMLSGLSDGLRFLLEEGLPLPEKSRPLVVVEAPLRHDLAQAADDGLVLVSDRAFRMVAADRFLRFHRFPVLREVFLSRALVQLRELGGDDAAALAADALGSWLLDRYVGTRFGRAENAFDVLDTFSFIPAIDSMLYAPDLPFVGAYFRLIKEEDPLRDDFFQFPRRLPRGKLIYEKLVDRAGSAAIERAFRATLKQDSRFFDAAGAALGSGAESFWSAWLGPYPDVRYRLAGWSETATAAVALIERHGDPIAEPIEVLFEDSEGGKRVVRAPASTEPVRAVTATLAAPLERVLIDPHGRLAEIPSASDPSPRFDNRSDPEWKILLNNFAILLSATEGEIDTAIDLGFGKKHDVHWKYALRADYAQEAIGVSGRALRYFGRTITTARLEQWFGLTLSGDYLRPGFANAGASGLALSGALYYGFDNRASAWAPEPGTAIRVAAELNHVFGTIDGGADLDPIAADPGRSGPITRDALALTARAVRQWTFGLSHQLAIKGSVGAYLLGQPRPQLLYPIGGRYGARGYPLDAAVGRYRALASAEWLHPLIPEMNLNALVLWWVNSVDGALFADVAVIGDDLDDIRRKPVLADVGYGLRLYIDYFGVRPGVMAIDVAVPLVSIDGRTEIGPPAVYIDFSQSFVNF